ncbi:MAG: DUF2799 domain-containing protein [Hyphomonadaceae bacterium]|nr:DUF2799 domain-containing protein [Hyphomonadaceae bacterium]
MKLHAWALAGAVVALAMLAGCETMSAEECAVADWRQLGYADADRTGQDGFANRAQSCAEKGVSADANAYRSGFADGLRAFCQPPRGFDFARRGGTFNGYCPADLDEDFRYALGDGRRVYDLQQSIDEARRNVDNATRRRAELDDDIRGQEGLLQAATSDDERRRIRDTIEGMRRERRDVNDDIRVAQEQLPRLSYQMNILRSELGSRWGNSW